jgi:hypothetical protein
VVLEWKLATATSSLRAVNRFRNLRVLIAVGAISKRVLTSVFNVKEGRLS